MHIPVMLDEVVRLLQPERGGLFVDCTVGLGGHARGTARARRRPADRPRSRSRRRWPRRGEALAAWGDRVELVHADYRELAAVLDERGVSTGRRRAGRSRRVVDAARRGGPRVQLSPRRAARHADGHDARETAAELLAQVDEKRAGRRDLPVRRRAQLAADRARALSARERAAARDDGPGGRHRAARAAGGRGVGHGSGSTRRRARFRRCASGSTASSKGSTEFLDAATGRLATWRAAGGDHVSFARGPDREAHVSRLSSSGEPAAGASCSPSARWCRSDETKWRGTHGRAAPSCAWWSGRDGKERNLRIRDSQGRPQQPDRPRGRRAPAARAVAVDRHRRRAGARV